MTRIQFIFFSLCVFSIPSKLEAILLFVAYVSFDTIPFSILLEASAWFKISANTLCIHWYIPCISPNQYAKMVLPKYWTVSPKYRYLKILIIFILSVVLVQYIGRRLGWEFQILSQWAYVCFIPPSLPSLEYVACEVHISKLLLSRGFWFYVKKKICCCFGEMEWGMQTLSWASFKRFVCSFAFWNSLQEIR